MFFLNFLMGNSQGRPNFGSAATETSPTSPFSKDQSANRQATRHGERRRNAQWRRSNGRERGARLQASWTEPPAALDLPAPFSCVDWRTDFDERFELETAKGPPDCFARERETGERVSVEAIDRRKNCFTEIERFRELDCELSVRLDLKPSPVVNSVRGCYLTRDAYVIVSDPCDGPTLREELQETGPMSESMVATVLLSAMEILRICREKRILHGHVTSEAFRLKSRKTDPFKMDSLCFAPKGWLKAAQFPHSRYIFHGDRLGNPHDPWDLPSKSALIEIPAENGCLGGGRYSKQRPKFVYLAPEIFAQYYAYESDMWSLGILGYELLTGRLPFWASLKQAFSHNELLTRRAILTRKADFDSPPFNNVSTTCLDFFYRVLQKNPFERINIYDAMAHPWIDRRVRKGELPHIGEGYMINPELL